MSRQTREGFTLVELLVVITIIGMLVAMLVPAVGAIREQARLTECKNNHHNIHLAAGSYEAARGSFPSYFFSVGNDEARTFSWVVALFPYIGEGTLHKRWVEGENRSAWLSFMFCPSDPPETISQSPSNYKANLLVLCEPRPFSCERVNNNDGAQYTLLIAEDVKDGQEHYKWDLTDAGAIETQLCFTTAITDDDSDDDDGGSGAVKGHLGSKHSAGIVVATCAGNVRTISDDIDDMVYQAIVTPDGGELVDEDMFK